MAVRIRLARHGRKASPFYHIVAADSRSPRDGRYIEKIGTYNPMKSPAIIDLDFDRALYWLNVGAQPSDTARSILKREGVLYKKHLEGGVKKGAFNEEVADQKFQAWLESKRKQDEDAMNKIKSEVDAKAQERLEVEAKISQERAEKIAQKKAETEAATQAEEASSEEEAPASEEENAEKSE